MARISITNGFTTQTTSILTDAQVEQAAAIAAQRRDAAYEDVDGHTFATDREWLEAYCDAHERHHGEVFVAW